MPPIGPIAHVGTGTLEPLQLVPPLAIAVAYAIRARTLALRGRPVEVWRQLSFAAGVALILASLVSPLAHLGGELLVAHMAQHLVIGDLAALLIVLGLTGPLLQPLLAIRWLDRLRVARAPAGRAAALGAEPLRLAHPGALRGGADERAAARARARDASSASGC